MKFRKIVSVILFCIIIGMTVIISGGTLIGTEISVALYYDGEAVFEKTYECEGTASLEIKLFHGGSPQKLYLKRFYGNPKGFFNHVNESIYTELSSVIKSFDCDAVEPTVKYEGSGKFVFTKGKDGIKCNVTETLKMLAAEGKSEIIYEKVFPGTDINDLKEFTVKAAEHTTYYSTSSAARKKNIETAASRLNGITVLPGERMSFNEVVGPRTKENGFEEAKVIINGEYTEGVGGGVCQVSTTLYNAWLKTGQQVISSRCHSLKPSYVAPGFDAMVSETSDLILYNGSAYPMYISSVADGTKLTFTIYTKPVPCGIKLTNELIKTIPCNDYETVEGETDEILVNPINGSVYRSYREFYENGEVYVKEYLRTSAYLPQKGKKSIKKDNETRIENEEEVQNNNRTLQGGKL